jgi:cobalt-zinc-cadmium resistance protein CzcA
MEGLLMISYFNDLRAQGLPLYQAVEQGALKRVRLVMITAMTAILGLLPAAFSTSLWGRRRNVEYARHAFCGE